MNAADTDMLSEAAFITSKKVTANHRDSCSKDNERRMTEEEG